MMKNFMRDLRPTDDFTMDSKMAVLGRTIATNNAIRNAICSVCNAHRQRISLARQ